MLLILAIFTTTHSFGASLFYAHALKRRSGSSAVDKAGGCFIFGHMFFWYGMPTAILVGMTWTPAPALALIHLLCSPSGTRLWRAVAYGSAFFSLLLLVSMTGKMDPQTPIWLFASAVAFQVALLRLQGAVVARHFLQLGAQPSKQ